MSQSLYAVFLFPAALEALGAPITPYLAPGEDPHVLCSDVSNQGSFIEIDIQGKNEQGEVVNVELLVPTSMVRLIISVRGQDQFGFS